MNSNFFSWLFDVNSIWGFLKKLGITILGIILVIAYIIGVGSIAGVFMTSSSEVQGYIMVNSSTINFIILMFSPALFIGFIILYFVVSRHVRNDGRYYARYSMSPIRGYKSSPSIVFYRIIFTILILGTGALFIYSINNYYVVFDNKILMHNILDQRRQVYTYDDIKEVSIGVKDRGKYGGDLYYKVEFKNGKYINLGSSAISFEDDPVKSLVKINDIIKSKGIIRKIDKTHFHDLTEDLSEEYVREYEKLFVE